MRSCASSRELGWVEGQNLVIEYRWAEGKIERLPELAAELVRLKVDLIVAPAGIRSARGEECDEQHSDRHDLPERSGQVGASSPSLQATGGNVTGTTSTPSRRSSASSFRLLTEAIPGATRVAFLMESGRRRRGISRTSGGRCRPFPAHAPQASGGARSRRNSIAPSPRWRKTGRTRFWSRNDVDVPGAPGEDRRSSR